MRRTKVAFLFLAILRAQFSDASDLGGQQFKLTAADASQEDFFGGAVAVAGGRAVIGSAQANLGRDANAGAAYVFDLATGQQILKLTASDASQGDRFGASVGISGNIAIAGAPFRDDGGAAAGAAYLFDVTTGQQLFKLLAPDGAGLDLFGQAVALDGAVAIAGAPGDDDGAPGAGAAYLFDATTGQHLFKLVASDPVDGRLFGNSVAISGNVALVGAATDDGAGVNSGAAYTFDVSTGQQIHRLLPSDAGAFDAFGNSVAMSGNIAIIGAYIKDGAGNQSGAAYLFDVSTGQQLHKLTASDASAEDHFGFSVAIDGNIAMVSAYRELNKTSGDQSSSVYFFDVSTGEQLLNLRGHDTAIGDGFGNSVGISGRMAVVGAPGVNHPFVEAGAAYVFLVPEPQVFTIVATLLSSLVFRRRVRHSMASTASR